MTSPVSVVMNTARSGHAMMYMPETHHFQYVIEFLRRQDFKQFEFIISDVLHDKRAFDWKSLGPVSFPIYHVPVTHSIFKNNGYCAISATKNNGIMFASGDYVIFLDDCCTGPSDYISKILRIWRTQKTFPNPLHQKLAGTDFHYDQDGQIVRDCRFKILDQLKLDDYSGLIHAYGYQTFSMKAILEVNGFDEMLDGSKQMEDQDLSERFQAAGYKISIHRRLVVNEQEHLTISKPPLVSDLWCHGAGPDVIEFKPNLKCNGAFYFLRYMRQGKDAILMNHRGLNEEEKKLVKPCFKLEGTRCTASGVGCNWINPDGSTNHMIPPDSNLYFTNPPVFSLTNERSVRLAMKQQYRVL